MAVLIAAVVIGAAVGIMGNNSAAAAQQDAINRQAYADRIAMIDKKENIEFAREFNDKLQESDELQADINFADDYARRLENYNLIYDNQNISLGYQGRTVESIENVRAADEAAWEYDNKWAQIQLDTNKAMMNVTYAQKTLEAVNSISSINSGLSALASSQEAGIQASQTANMWSNIGTVTSSATMMASYTTPRRTQQTQQTSFMTSQSKEV